MKRSILINSYFISAVFLLFVLSCNSEASSENDISTDSVTIAKGQKSFVEKCSGCHNFLQDGIGPQLSGVTSLHSVDWIKNFIKDPKKVIDSGDSTAQKLFNEYKALMPSFASLPDEEIDALIAFIHTQKRLERKLVYEDTNDLKNPIPDTITTSDLIVDVDSVTQIPPSSDQPPFTRIIKLDYQPVTNDLYILDLRGKLYKLQNGQPKVYMDMAALKPKFIHQPGLATGFGSFAFHPDFAKNRLLYTTHAETAEAANADFNYPESNPVVLQWVLTEWKTDSLGIFPFSGKDRELFRVNMPSVVHGVQEISFNRIAKPGDKDYGLLYIGVGDGGSALIGQSLVSEVPNKIWGSIVRIDPAGRNSKNGQYGIPSHNPFNNDPKAVKEIYAWGFRNPHRISWSKSGQLLAVNIGEHNIESLNMIMPGHFYGWPIREGNFLEQFFNDKGKVYPLPSNDSIYHVTYPVAQFDHDEGTAISGGFEYRGTAITQLTGKYVFGDIGTGRLFYVNVKDFKLGSQAPIKKWNISVNGVPTTLAKLCGDYRVDMRFGMDNKGELYLFTKRDGKVYKLVKPKGQ